MKVDFRVIKRFLDGKGQKGDKELILSWFTDIRTETDLRDKYKRYWDELSREPDLKGYDSNKILNRIYHEIKLNESRQQPRHKVLRRFTDIAAKFAAVLFMALAAYLYFARDQVPAAGSRTACTEIYSPPGTRTMFYLPDGSNGWLNGGSYLEFPTVFRGKSREVVLRGEAFFNVRSDPRKQFLVTCSHDVTVTATGTSFNVLAYPDDGIREITLVSGRIRVDCKKNGKIQYSKILKPDQQFTYERLSSVSVIIPVDADQVICWKDGKMVFKDESLKKVVSRLNRWYNVNIVIMDEILESYIYLATFEDETLEEVLKLLRLSAPIEYRDLGRARNDDGTFTKRRIELYYRDGK